MTTSQAINLDGDNLTIRVDCHPPEIVGDGDFDGCMEIWETLNKMFPERIYIVREKNQALKNIEAGEIL